nr:hypothetical protein [Nitrosomonas nitrosa]
MRTVSAAIARRMSSGVDLPRAIDGRPGCRPSVSGAEDLSAAADDRLSWKKALALNES